MHIFIYSASVENNGNENDDSENIEEFDRNLPAAHSVSACYFTQTKYLNSNTIPIQYFLFHLAVFTRQSYEHERSDYFGARNRMQSSVLVSSHCRLPRRVYPDALSKFGAVSSRRSVYTQRKTFRTHISRVCR